MNKNYLRNFGIHEVKIEEVKKDTFKEQEYFLVVFKDKTDRYIDLKAKLPLSDISKKQIDNLKKACGVALEAKALELKDKSCLILVSPAEVRGKTYWNPTKFWSMTLAKYLNATDTDPFGMDAPPPATDDDGLGL